MATFNWVEGWTSKRKFQMLSNGSPTDLTGLTLSDLLLRKTDGTLVTTTGDFAIETVATGICSFTPDATDLVAADSPLEVHWQFTDGSSGISFWPDGEGDKWIIHQK